MENQNKEELSFVDLFRLFMRKIWVFVIALVVFIIACFAYFYIQPEEYTYESSIKVAEDYIANNNNLYNYYPEDLEKLWLFPTHRRDSMEEVAMDVMVGELYSEETRGALSDGISGNIENIISYINITKDTQNNNISIATTYSDPETAKELNSLLNDIYIGKKQSQFEEIYEVILQKITKDVGSLEAELEELNNKKNKAEAEYSLENSKPRDERNIDYLAEKLAEAEKYDRKINNKNDDYNILFDTQNNLMNNKDFFVNRITVVREPYLLRSNTFNLRNSIIYSILIGLVAAFIITFIVTIASYARYIRRH